jgi:hypothetical protein
MIIIFKISFLHSATALILKKSRKASNYNEKQRAGTIGPDWSVH